MFNFITAVSAVIGALALLVFISFILSIPVWLLWNGCLVDAIDGVREVTWLQAWGLSILAGFLFKSTTVQKS
jgi:hypothetical protein